MTWQTPEVAEIAGEIRDCLNEGEEFEARRLALRVLEYFEKADDSTRLRIVARCPESTGSAEYDALLAGLVEFACARHRLLAPKWVNDNRFFLETWWFPSGIESLHADALVHSPISLARRGVYVTQDALTSV